MKQGILTLDNDPEGILHRDVSQELTGTNEGRQHTPLMSGLCEMHNGLGLAATQVGLALNMFWAAAASGILPQSSTGYMCINPRWVPAKGARQVLMHGEGCLSIPGRRFAVSRWTRIEAQWMNTQGHMIKRTLKGTAAQVFQHETDHLRGVTLNESGTPES